MRTLILIWSIIGFLTLNVFAQTDLKVKDEKEEIAARISPDYGIKDFDNIMLLTTGKYDVEDLHKTVGNDNISYLDVSEGFTMTVYEHDKFAGKSKEFIGPVHVSLKDDDFDNQISSLIIELN